MIEAVLIPFFPQFLDKDSGVFRANDAIESSAGTMLDELARWTQALQTLRE